MLLEREGGLPQLRGHRPADGRRAPHRASRSRPTRPGPEANPEFDTPHLPLQLPVAGDAALGLRLRHGDAGGDAPQAAAGARRLRPPRATRPSASSPPPPTACRCPSRSSTARGLRRDGTAPVFLYGYGVLRLPPARHLLLEPAEPPRPRRRRRPRPRPRRRRAGQGLARRRADAEEEEHLHRLHRRRRAPARRRRTAPRPARHRGRQRGRPADGRGGEPAARTSSRRWCRRCRSWT